MLTTNLVQLWLGNTVRSVSKLVESSRVESPANGYPTQAPRGFCKVLAILDAISSRHQPDFALGIKEPVVRTFEVKDSRWRE